MMRKLVTIPLVSLALFLGAGTAHAAGAVEMQVEHILRGALDEYNEGMEAGDASPWVKYFTPNVIRSAPGGTQIGKEAFSAFYEAEFKAYKAHISVRRILVSGRTGAMVLGWDAVDRATGKALSVEMAMFVELASSGRFESLALYFDPAGGSRK